MYFLTYVDPLLDVISVYSLTECESKELEEMLAQEDLGEMGLSSPGEQVAYLLVERATLLERLEAVEMSLESRSIPEKEDSQQVKAQLFDISNSNAVWLALNRCTVCNFYWLENNFKKP